MEASYATRLLANLNNLRQNSNHGNLCDVEIGKITLLSSDGLGFQIPVFGFNMFHGEMDLCESSLQNDFLHFLAIFDDFSKLIMSKTLRNFEKSSNMANNIWQKIMKTFVQLAVNPFFG